MMDIAKLIAATAVILTIIGSLSYCGVTHAQKQQQFQADCQANGGVWIVAGSAAGSCFWSRP